MEYLELETEFANFIGTDGCVSVSTGTGALHVALEALQLPEGSEVIVPQYTMIATAWAVHYARLVPVFVDCDSSLLINIEEIESKITERTKVIMVTHVYGRVVNMKAVENLAKKYNLRIIEDSAEAHGCRWNNKIVGATDIGCFSFYRNKIVSGEEGGAVVSNDLEFLNIVRDMKSMSFGKKHNYMHDQIGFNYRMTNSQAKLILKSLSNFKQNVKKRRYNQELYDNLIDKKYHMPSRDIPWVYDVCVEDNTIVDKLNDMRISARYGFKPVSMCYPFRADATDTLCFRMSKKILYLPLDPDMDECQINYVVDRFNELVEVS